ncbi:phosphoribosylanthranilate isomerase [[Limnothrix rosea] IAM M-220]|uniref:phosphoribosylanthranilate isomerase n=1 Tax=[Limnothrix rosea] IAM M-220 TaxID=454133 RepID=UPI00095EB42F|nr:phosphoribosylanthranilate isomerase [[Limnothrix rosea] IAM M-220]OKH19034.1 N-(5'-phosphoribosyl)anthranilate isomerase [[Limnothrix rosea] IAM M-220]
MRLKICGLTRVDQAVAIAAMGATDIGFICVKKSPRYITPENIQPIAAALPDATGKVGVFAHQTPEEIAEIAQDSGLSTIQLHSDESPEFCQQVRQLLPNLELIKALRVRDRRTLETAKDYETVVDVLLLDAYHPEQLGGTGHTINWEDLQAFKPNIPWLLAGGLKPDNIQQALTQLQPDGIDLSSGVEDSPGLKNMDQVAALMAQLAAFNA